MKDKAKIQKIEITVAGKTLNLTIEQAKKLRDILNETFPAPQPHPIIIDRIIPAPYPVWPHPSPIWATTEWTATHRENEVMCISASGQS